MTDSPGINPPALDRPIIIIGAGRSGSTVFHELLARHSALASLSRLCDRFPDRPAVNHLYLKAIDLPLVGDAIARMIPPDENYRFWELRCPGFRQPFRDLTRGDLTPRSAQRVRSALAAMLTAKRNRMLIKITGWPRMTFLHEMFPDARFVHVVRDGRAVSSSLMEIEFWRGWRGSEGWRFGPLSSEYQHLWEKHDRSFVALAGIQWRITLDAVRNGRSQIPPEQFLELKYEDLCRNPIDVLRDVTTFAELPWDRRLESAVPEFQLRDTNDKWRKDLSRQQQQILEDVLSEDLSALGYLAREKEFS